MYTHGALLSGILIKTINISKYTKLCSSCDGT